LIDIAVGVVEAVEHALDEGDAVFRRQCSCPLDQRLALVAHLGSLPLRFSK
jgi:hypothetical protein